ncbi:MAG: SDR family oxidoreductase, partial [Myxococcota bacterium]
IGFAITRRLLAQGWNVVATDRTTGDWPADLGAPRPELRVLSMDVRNDADVRAAAREAGPVDLLVNNAGIAVFGTQEESDLASVHDMFDVNVLGSARVTQALLPALRASRGTVVQISSLAGKAVFPESGFYAATKHAVEAMAEALIQETAPLGLRVRLVEPGNYATRLQQTAAAASGEVPPDSPYAALRPVWDARRESVLQTPGDPDEVAEALVASLDQPDRFLRVVVGPDAQDILGLRRGIGGDAFVQLSIERNGGPAGTHGRAHVLTPGEVLAAAPDELGPTRAALRHGHLDHWAETDKGRRALARLES